MKLYRKLLIILLVSFIGMNSFAENDSSGFYATIGKRKAFLLYNTGEVVPNCDTAGTSGFKCAEKCCQRDDCTLNIGALPNVVFDCKNDYNNAQNQASANNINPPVAKVDVTNSNNNDDENIQYRDGRIMEPTAWSRKHCLSAPGMMLMNVEQPNGNRVAACALKTFIEDDRQFNIKTCAVDRKQNVTCTYKP